MAQMSQSQLAREDRSTDLRMRRVGRRYCACAGREGGGGVSRWVEPAPAHARAQSAVWGRWISGAGTVVSWNAARWSSRALWRRARSVPCTRRRPCRPSSGWPEAGCCCCCCCCFRISGFWAMISGCSPGGRRWRAGRCPVENGCGGACRGCHGHAESRRGLWCASGCVSAGTECSSPSRGTPPGRSYDPNFFIGFSFIILVKYNHFTRPENY